jgi:2-dehydro-3-deoxygluconokinase
MLRCSKGVDRMSEFRPTMADQPTADAVLCFGELLFRLGAPGRETLLQSPRLDVHFGGAEANVAIALAGFGHRVRMVSTLPANALGAAARGELRRHGVDADAVQDGPGRMGLYFLQTGAMSRASEVLYDRAGSAFALADAARYDWPRLLRGARWLHLSGVTPAVSAVAADAAVAAARAAVAAGVPVSFDGNFRQSLWAVRGADPRPVLRELMDCATVLFADHRDIGLVFGMDVADFDASAQAAFAAMPRLTHLAATRRAAGAADRQALGADLATRSTRVTLAPRALDGVVDRIGGGDAFAAGFLHGLLQGRDADAMLGFALACACLKHSVPGDFVRFGVDAVDSLLREERIDVRR